MIMENYKELKREDLDCETWAPIKDFPRYLVSDLGRVKNLNGDMLKQGFNGEYLILGLTRLTDNGKKRKTVRVHRLVAITFVSGETEHKCTVNHADNNKINNKASNLEWLSLMENKQMSYKHGQNKYKNTPDDIREIRKLSADGMSGKDIAAKMGLGRSIISDILTGKKWSYIE